MMIASTRTIEVSKTPVDAGPPTERERFEFEKQKFQSEQDLKLRSWREEATVKRWDSWKSPVTLAIVGGIITVLANILASSLANHFSSQQEDQKFEADLIKKFLEPESQDQRTANLEFLVGSGLISRYGDAIHTYLKTHPSAVPRALPAAGETPINNSAFGADNRLDSTALEALVTAQSSVVAIQVQNGTDTVPCSGVFISEQEIATAAYCIAPAMSAGSTALPPIKILLGSGAGQKSFTAAKVEFKGASSSEKIALIAVTEPAAGLPLLTPSTDAPAPDDRLIFVYASEAGKIMAAFDEECRVIDVTDQSISYRCDASRGSAGGAVISLKTGQLLAVHTYVDTKARYGRRLDTVAYK
jgi:V8-like Glu-specific endopeptidase